MKKSLLIGGSLALAALLVLPLSNALARGPHGPGGGSFGGHGFGPFMVELLDLSEEQQTQLSELRESSFGERGANREEMASFHQELQELWAADTPDKQAILAKMAEMDAMRAQQREKMVDFRIAVLDILTPEQREKLAQLQEKAPGRGERGMGQRRGSGGKW